jgi:hypothetical protein
MPAKNQLAQTATQVKEIKKYGGAACRPCAGAPGQRANGGVRRDAVNTAFIPLFDFVFVSLFSESCGLACRIVGDGLGRFLAEGMGDRRSRALIPF